MDSNYLIFGFTKQDPKLIRFKNKYFKFVASYFEHMRVSIAFKTTKKKSTSLRYFLSGTRSQLYALGYTFEKASKIIRKLEKLVKQVYKQLSQFELLDKLSEYEILNGTPRSLFVLVRTCEKKPVISSVTLTKRNALVA